VKPVATHRKPFTVVAALRWTKERAVVAVPVTLQKIVRPSRGTLHPCWTSQPGQVAYYLSASLTERLDSMPCPHDRQRSTSKECGGAGICHHNLIKSRRKECDRASICEHNRRRSRCKVLRIRHLPPQSPKKHMQGMERSLNMRA
jgi:hypothetical protein